MLARGAHAACLAYLKIPSTVGANSFVWGLPVDPGCDVIVQTQVIGIYENGNLTPLGIPSARGTKDARQEYGIAPPPQPITFPFSAHPQVLRRKLPYLT